MPVNGKHEEPYNQTVAAVLAVVTVRPGARVDANAPRTFSRQAALADYSARERLWQDE